MRALWKALHVVFKVVKVESLFAHDMCPSDWRLFRGPLQDARVCTCGAPRIERKALGHKDTQFRSIGEWLRRMFSVPAVAEQSTYAADRCAAGQPYPLADFADDELIRTFLKEHPEFAAKRRNVIILLSADGVLPFDNSKSYSVWPFFLVPLSLPSWLRRVAGLTTCPCIVPGSCRSSERCRRWCAA